MESCDTAAEPGSSRAAHGSPSDPPVWTVMLAGACAFLTFYATQPILPVLAEAFHLGKAGASLTVFASTLGVALSAPFMGMLADRLGRRNLIVWCSVALGLTSVLAGTSATLTQLIAWRFVQGVFTPGVFAITVTYINEEWPMHKAGSAMAAYVSGTVLGGFFGRFLSGIVTQHANWRAALVVLGAAGLAMAVTIGLRLPREQSGHVSQGCDPVLTAAARHLRNPALVARYATGFCVLFTLVATFTWVTFYLASPPFHLSPAVLGATFVVYLAGAAVTPAAGRWIDSRGSRSTVMRAAALGMAGIALTLVQHVWAVAMGLAITCTGVFVTQAAINRSLGQCAKDNRALAVGLYASFYYLGGSAGATLPAWVWGPGGWPACVALVAGAQLLTFGIARWGWESAQA